MFLTIYSINKISLRWNGEIPLRQPADRDDSFFFGHIWEGSRERATPALCYPPNLKKNRLSFRTAIYRGEESPACFTKLNSNRNSINNSMSDI